MIDFIKTALIPGSMGFLLLGLAAGLILLYAGDKTERWGRRWLLSLGAAYLALSLPATAGLLERSLGGQYARFESGREQAVVILGGGGLTYRDDGLEVQSLSDASILRTLEGLRIFHQLEEPWIVVSGGPSPQSGLTQAESETMRDLLIDLGAPAGRVLVEAGSADTHDQALNVPALLQAHGVSEFVLVTSTTHLRRAMLSFEAAGFEPTPGPAPERSETQSLPAPLLPDLGALDASRRALREWMGLLYYAVRGWIQV
jgi:uncharacterized SAM-binding protein YcdF (DUF218 family)